MKHSKDTCWYDTEVCPNEMLKGARGELFPSLENADHFPFLDHLVKQLPENASVLDLGCGAGAFSTVYNRFFYTGADLLHVITKTALQFNSRAKFVKFDAYEEEDYDILELFDVILMNAFIDIMEHPMYVLKNVLKNAENYVLLHRQEFSNVPTHTIMQPSYGGQTFHSIINHDEFLASLTENNFFVLDKVRISCYTENNTYSYLLKKN